MSWRNGFRHIIYFGLLVLTLLPQRTIAQAKSKIWLGVEASYNPTFSMRGDHWGYMGIPVFGSQCLEVNLKTQLGKKLFLTTGLGLELLQINRFKAAIFTNNMSSGIFVKIQEEGATHRYSYNQLNTYLTMGIEYRLFKIKENHLNVRFAYTPSVQLFLRRTLRPLDTGITYNLSFREFYIESLSRFRLGASYLINLKKGFQLEANLGTWIYNFQFRQIAIHLGLSLYKQL